jgi:gliding motility-associated-like protein
VDANGCTTSGTVTISDLPAPRIDSVNVTPITCFGFTDGTATVYPKVGGNVNLNFNWLNTSGSTVGSAQTLSGVGAGTYIVQVSDGNGCMVDTILTITQPNPLTLTTSTNQTACNGQVLGVYASAGGGTPAYAYTWGGAGAGLNGGGNHNVTFTNTTSSAQTQVFTVSVTDANNCPAQTGQFTVLINPRITPVPSNAAGCAQQTQSVSASASGGDGAPYTFTWSTGASTTGSSSSISAVVGSNSTTYTVTVSDGCSTPEDTVVTLTSYPNPVASFLGLNLQGCSPLLVSFAGSSGQTGDADYEWFFGDGSSATDSVLTHVYLHSGTSNLVETFNVTLVVTSQNGCKDTITNNAYVQVYAQPDAEFIPSPASQNELNPVFEFDNLSQNGTTYLWNFGEPTSSANTSSVFSPIHTYENSGTYMVTLVVSNAQGCVDTVQHPVTVEPEFAIYVPNAFTPNANGLNDYFQAKGIGIDESRFKMFIFDRWGEMIFQTDNFDRGWDGTAKGKTEIVQQDVYVWKIETWDLKNVKHELVGHVTVVK